MANAVATTMKASARRILFRYTRSSSTTTSLTWQQSSHPPPIAPIAPSSSYFLRWSSSSCFSSWNSNTTNGAGAGAGAGAGSRWLSTASYPSHEVVGMPSLSPTMEAGTIASWNVNEGESFAAGDVLCEVETDKATVSFEAQDDGVIAKILAEAGPNEIQCGEPILITVEEVEDVDAFKDFVPETTGVESAASSAPVSTPPPPSSSSSSAHIPTTPPSTSTSTSSSTVPTSTSDTAPPAGGRTVASPLAWTLAKEKGLDLSSIALLGTGPDGRIVADDVREYIPALNAVDATAVLVPPATTTSTPAPPSQPVRHEHYTDYPLTQSAITSAQLLTQSKQTVPHYYLTVDVTLDNLLTLRSNLNKALSEQSSSSSPITLNDLLLKATACAMKSCPAANATWMAEEGVVRQFDNVDVNFVMRGSDGALYAPVVRNVGGKGVKSVSDDVASFLSSIDKDGDDDDDIVESSSMTTEVGTVTVMNLGMYGIKSCAPIIREPQAVALALGAAENRVVPKDLSVNDDDDDDDGEIYEVKVVLTATLSCDHRVVDGAVGAEWLSAFKSAVENPETLLL